MKGVEVNFEKKTATVDFDPSQASVEQLIASLAKKKKFSAKLCMAVQSSMEVGIGTWGVSTEPQEYAPEGSGKLVVHFEPSGGSVSGVKIELAGEAGVKVANAATDSPDETTTAKDYPIGIEVAKDVKKKQLLVKVTITFQAKDARGKQAAGKIELPAVVLVQM